MQKIDVAVVGVGHLGIRHARVYKELANANLVAVCDINPQRLNEVSKTLNVPGHLYYQELIPKVKAVSIAVPTSLHYKIARDFLAHKIHLLVEKPFAVNLKEADSLIKLGQKNNLILQVGHIERFNSAFAAIKEVVREPRFIECHRLSPFPERSLDIGVVLDLMIHDIDIILGLVNSTIKNIAAVGVNVLTSQEDIANARLTFKNGCICNLTASRISEEWMRKIRIFFKNAYISLDYKNAEAFIYRKVGPSTTLRTDGEQGRTIGPSISKESLPIEKEEPLKKELASFLDCIIYKKAPLVSGKVGRQALAVALEIQKKIWLKKRF